MGDSFRGNAYALEPETDEYYEVIYDSQPVTLEEVQTAIGAYEAKYQIVLEAEGDSAALEVQKPHWRYEVPAELMPDSYNCQYVDWDEDFEAVYYTFVDETYASEPETDEYLEVIYDPQPATVEEVQAAIDAYEEEYQTVLETEGYLAALEVQRPHWQYEIPAELMPGDYNCQFVDWDEDFGAEYYTFFANPAKTKIISIPAGASTTTIQTAINGASAKDIIEFQGKITLTTALEVNKSLTFRAAAAAGAVEIVSSTKGSRHIIIPSGLSEITLEFVGIKLKGGVRLSGTFPSPAYSGGITANSPVVISGAVIQDCDASPNGGGIYALKNLTLLNSEITGCKNYKNNAGRGGGGGIAMDCDAGTFSMVGCTITGNSSDISGGGILVGSENTVVDINNSRIENNTAEGGGGLYVFKAGNNITITNGTVISGNRSSVYSGGGVYLLSVNNTLNIINSTISENKSNSVGGGIYIDSGQVQTTYTYTGQPTQTEVNITGSTVSGNTASTRGGGIYVSGNHKLYTGYQSQTYAKPAEVILIDTEISGNTATTSGGGIHLAGSNLTMDATTEIINNGYDGTGAAVTLNGGGVYMEAGQYADGGTVYIASSLTMNGGFISGNKATTNGGGVYATGYSSTYKATFTMADGAVTNNKAGSNGGGVYLNNQYTVAGMTKGDIGKDDEPNEAVVGGGVYVNTGGEFSIAGGSVGGNSATTVGGGVYVAGGKFSMVGGSVSGNSATTSGGGVYATASSTFTMEDGSVDGNKATMNGGGVFVGNSLFSLKGGSVDSNNATQYGGGIYISTGGGTVTMTGGTITKNTAVDGGGAYIASGTGTFSMSTGAISDNTAVSGHGGGVYVAATTTNALTVSGGSITGNTAALDGGGIYTVAAGSLTTNYNNLTVGTAVTFSGNTAQRSYDPLDANGKFSAYWTSINNTSYTLAVNPTTVSRLVAVNNFDINVQLMKVIFDTNGGDYFEGGTLKTIPNQILLPDAKVDNPVITANNGEMFRVGYTFVGWYLKDGTNSWNFSTGTASTMADAADGETDGIITLYAKWEAIKGTITINKFKDNGTSPLKDVTFTLTDADDTEIASATTDVNGVATFTNISPGDYTITETRVPEGYSLLAESFEAKVPVDVTGTSYTGATKQTTPDGTQTFGYDLTYRVTNQTSFVMPSAGSAGIWNQYYLWIGMALLLAGGGSAVWWMKRRGMQRTV